MNYYFKCLLCVLLIGISAAGYAKGREGKYYIKGSACGKGRKILADTILLVTIGSETKEVKTDDKGQFEFDVPWRSPCHSAMSHSAWIKTRKSLNPKFIYIKHGTAEIKVKNKWKKYANLYTLKKDIVTKYEDLIFDKN